METPIHIATLSQNDVLQKIDERIARLQHNADEAAIKARYRNAEDRVVIGNPPKDIPRDINLGEMWELCVKRENLLETLGVLSAAVTFGGFIVTAVLGIEAIVEAVASGRLINPLTVDTAMSAGATILSGGIFLPLDLKSAPYFKLHRSLKNQIVELGREMQASAQQGARDLHRVS